MDNLANYAIGAKIHELETTAEYQGIGAKIHELETTAEYQGYDRQATPAIIKESKTLDTIEF